MIPCAPGLEYLPYQEEGIEFAMNRPVCLFGDEMGLGKTIQAIGWMNCHPGLSTVLVVCPATLKINWRREMDKWLISPFVDVTITNYDQLHKLDRSKHYDLCILDEAHYIKNRKAIRSRYCRGIKATYRLALTGTPMLNRPIELWHILHWLAPEIWPMSSYMKYALRYCGAYRNHWGWVMDGATHLDELRMHLSYIMIRRLKKDVLKDLPPKRRQIIELPWKGVSRDLRERLKAALELVRKIESDYAHDVRKMESAIQIVWSEIAEARHEAGLAKVPMAIDLIHDAIAANGKVVVFAYHRDVIEQLNNALVDYYPAVIHGDTSLRARQCAVDRFQNDPNVKVFIGQTTAAGVGITLTAASHVIFVELDWTPGVMSQAEDRLHRIGQRESVLVQHLALEGSLDAHMAKTLVRKQSILDKALNAPEKGGVEVWA